VGSDLKFTAEDFNVRGRLTNQDMADIANAKAAPLVAELERANAGYIMALNEANDCRAANAKLVSDLATLGAKIKRVLTQDRLKGYPTGAEWIALIKQVKE
jgi:hypothetical protein